mgnify:CR=1 FL=1
MTVSKLRTELTDAEFVHFAAYYQLKGEEEEKEGTTASGGKVKLMDCA